MLSAVLNFVGQDGIATPLMACVGSNKVLAPKHCFLRELAGRADGRASAPGDQTVPIVLATHADPVHDRHVASLARPAVTSPSAFMHQLGREFRSYSTRFWQRSRNDDVLAIEIEQRRTSLPVT
jgi:hypothetical protein